MSSLDPPTAQEVVATVAQVYGKVAQGSTETAKEFAASVGYTEEELRSVPERSYFGVGCGNPVKVANLKEGENVLDLGSGGGIDVFLAANIIGSSGCAVGLDVSLEMVALARANAKQQGLRPPHVAFVEGSLTDPLPISSDTIDCVISNCVVNLLPGSGKVSLFKELYRVLKPGGRVSIDDIIAKKAFSDEERNDLNSYVNCVSGSILLKAYKEILQSAGFQDIDFTPTKNDLSKPCGGASSCPVPSKSNTTTGTTTGCCSSATSLPSTSDVNALVASYHITAHKPSTAPIPDSISPNILLNWQDAYPRVKSQPPPIAVGELEGMMRAAEGDVVLEKRDFAVIDVRRNDHGGGHVRGSDNWHAQTFYDNLPSFLDKYRDTGKVMFYCSSSNGRGPRCAGWYQDYLNETGTMTSKAYVLKGGAKAWLVNYGDDDTLVDRD